jgi:hypothetical protein
MRISEESIVKLQTILKKQTSNEYDTERAQAAGRAILRLVGIKLYQVFEKDVENERLK